MEERIIPRMDKYNLTYAVHKCLLALVTDQEFTKEEFKEELDRFCPPDQKTPRFFNVLGYFTIFKNKGLCEDFAKHLQICTHAIDVINDVLDTIDLNDIEKQMYSYALAIYSFCFDVHYSKLIVNDDIPIEKFLEIEPTTREIVWAQYIICSAVVVRLQFTLNTESEDDYFNFTYFVKCLERSIELRDQFEELKTIHYDGISLRICYGKEDDGRDPS